MSVKYLSAIILVFVISACGGGGGGNSNPDPLLLPANNAPTIDGVPANAVAQDTIYSFIPSASDPDSDPITFSISNSPAWASFDVTTGSLTGAPTSADQGIYSDITISASDGNNTSDLGPFSIEVVQMATGSLTLAWLPPTNNVDGSPLNDLAGYRLKWGTQSGDHPNVIEIDEPEISRFVIENLVPGEYFILLSAIDTSNNESTASNEASGFVQ